MSALPRTLYSLFNFDRKQRRSQEKLLNSSTQSVATQGAFITPQSLMSFPVASSVVTGLHALFGKVYPEYSGSIGSLMIIALVIGLFIWVVGVTDPRADNTRRDLFISFFIAVINSCCLAMTALGIKTSAGI